MRALRLKIPPHPPLRPSLKRHHLRFDIPARLVLVLLAPLAHIVLETALADKCTSRIRPVEARTDAPAIQILRAVSHRSRPLAYDGPFIGARIGVCRSADLLDVLVRRHSDEAEIEDLVLVVVYHDILRVVIGRSEEGVPGIGRTETVVQHDGRVGCVAHLAEAFNIAVCPHFLMELHVALCAAVPNGRWVEYIPQLDDITTSRLAIAGGFAVAPSTAGLGIDWDFAAIDKRAVARATLTVADRAARPGR